MITVVATAGSIISMFDLVHNAADTAIPIAGLMVMYGVNDSMKVTLCFLYIIVLDLVLGYIGSLLLKNNPIHTAIEICMGNGKSTEAVA